MPATRPDSSFQRGPDAEERERLGHVVALRPHRRRAPDHEPDGLGHRAVLGDVTGDELVGEAASDVPRQWRRQRLRVDRIEVAARRQDVRHAAGSARRWARRARSRRRGRAGGWRSRRACGAARARAARRPNAASGRRRRTRQPSRCKAASRLATVLLDGVDVGAPFEADAQLARHGLAQRRHTARGQAGDREHEIELGVSFGRPAQRVEPAADLRVLELAEVTVDVQQEVVELVVGGRIGASEVAVDLGVDEQVPHLLPHGGDLRRVERLDLGVLVEELLEAGELVVGVGARERGHEVVDDHRVGAPLGLRPLAGVVHDERVEERQVAEGGVGRAGGGEPDALAREPFERAVLAGVHDRVRAEAGLQPAVEGEVVMRGRDPGRVVRRDRVGAEGARRLHGDEHAAEVEARERERVAVAQHVARRLAPGVDDLVAQLVRAGLRTTRCTRRRRVGRAPERAARG